MEIHEHVPAAALCFFFFVAEVTVFLTLRKLLYTKTLAAILFTMLEEVDRSPTTWK